MKLSDFTVKLESSNLPELKALIQKTEDDISALKSDLSSLEVFKAEFHPSLGDE